MSKYTKGPWFVQDDCSEGLFRIRAKGRSDGLSICGRLPDAFLIAASPELLEACEKANAVFHAKSAKEEQALRYELIGVLEKAIAKAKGRL